MMKNVKSILLTLAVVLGISAQANTRGYIEVNKHIKPDYSIISVINSDYTFDNLEVLCHTTGQTILSESIKNDVSFQKLVKPSNVGDGRYTVSLSGNTASVQKEYDIINGKLFSRESTQDIYEETEQMKFIFDNNKENLTVSFINAEKEDLIFVVTNLDRQKNVEYTEVGDVLGYSNIYNVEYLRKGNYRATLMSGDVSYHYDFEI